MVLLQPPSYCESDACYTPQQDRLLWGSIICTEGVQDGFEITPGGGMSVNIAAGAGFIQGDTQASEGMYWVSSTATENRAIAPADPTDPRYDLVIARINADCSWSLAVVTGTAAPAPSPPATPPSSIVLGWVSVTAGLLTVAPANILSGGAITQRAAVCTDLLPDTGWRTVAQGTTGSGTTTGQIPIPLSRAGDAPQHIRGTLSFRLASLGDVGIRVNGLSDAVYQSAYRSWNTAGALSTVRGVLNDTSYRIAYGGAGHSCVLVFEIAASLFSDMQISGRFSTIGPTLADMKSGLGEGMRSGSTPAVTAIEILTTATSFSRLTWTIEASYVS